MKNYENKQILAKQIKHKNSQIIFTQWYEKL